MSLRQRAAARLRVAVPADGPGASVLVLRGGDILYHSQRGLADLVGAPIGPRTAFDLASVSKHFTAVAVLQLVERGRLTLDAAVGDILPAWADYPSGRPLRLRDLLCHTSGLPDYSRLWRGLRASLRMTNARFLPKVLAQPPLFPAGARADYSNTNYILLAAVLEAVTGRLFADHLREALFDPLQLDDTAAIENPAHPVPRRARGYKRVGEIVQASDYPMRLIGHSHVFSTTTDLARWFGALWAGQVIAPDLVRAALTPGRLDDGNPHIYGLGWFDDSTLGQASMGHSGSWYGFSTYVRYFADQDLTLVVLSNDECFPNKRFVDGLSGLFRG